MASRSRIPARPPAPAVGRNGLYADLLRDETGELKNEQQRIGHRTGLIYATLTVIGAVGYAVIQTGIAHLLLALPPACAILGWTHLINDVGVSGIGQHLRLEIAPILSALAGRPVLRWETTHRADRRRRERKRIQLAADLCLFAVPGVTAVAVWVAVADRLPVLAVAAAADLVVVGVLVWQIVVYADLQAEQQ
jgi:hypothetical protein